MKRIIVISAFLAALAACLYVWSTTGVLPHYSDGSRTGKLVKFSRKGFVFKSYEGTVVVNPFAQGASTWEFSTTDESVARQLDNLVGSEVTITYSQYYVKPAAQDTTYTAISAVPAKVN